MRVCLISSVHPWVNPRIVKEADALAAWGHEVRVVTKRVDAWSDVRDARLLATKPWEAVRVNLMRHDRRGRWPWFRTAVRAELALRGYRLTGRLRLAEEGYYRGFGHVLRAAIDAGADLYIAHTQGALPIAARAAAAKGVPYAFDCEDLLAEEAADGLCAPARRAAILAIERAYLPGAAYVTATSRAMAEYLAQQYRIPLPFVIRNVFPLAALEGLSPPHRRPRREAVELVWLSASIGHGRGLEDAIAALAQLPAHVRLTVIGRMLPVYEREFWGRAERLAVSRRIAVRPILEPAELMRTITRCDIGLTLDPNDCLNRSLTICNKLFLYLQGGLLVAATDTPGQREIMATVPAGGFLYPPGDAEALAERLQPYATDGARLRAAQEAAWRAGQERYNWNCEQATFLAALEHALRHEHLAERMVVGQ